MRGVAGKILLAFREPFALGKDTVRVSASIGGALFPLDDRDSRDS
jgi:predicted signal transduction protein with EAL and GGDEF domain